MTHPFTEPGTEMLAYDFRISATIDVPDAGTVLVPAWNNNSLVLPSTSTVVLERALSAPQQLRVDGVAQPPSQGFTKLTFTNAPTVSWAAPSLGTPNFYRLQLVEMTLRSPGNYSSAIVSTVRTKATSATLPEGLLRPGHFYFIRVTAVVDPNDTDDGRQHLRTAVYRSAEAITTLFQVE